ncbi:MAG: hypothetical protein QOH93_470 [Chloroflexia bacterium]|jgi:hypothetical protein|nr:hypothetical protein [Chloroflexia bacterium]
MGFFNKLKNLVSKAAEVQMQVSEMQVRRGDSVKVVVTVNAVGQLDAKGVFLEITGFETVKYQYEEKIQGSTMTRTASGTKSNQTYSRRDPLLASRLTMNQGETRQFEGTVEIPPTAQPSYSGIDANHEWKIRALVDVSMGGDPDCETSISVL